MIFRDGSRAITHDAVAGVAIPTFNAVFPNCQALLLPMHRAFVSTAVNVISARLLQQ